ncbi:MAG: tetratricopeptide repeat protein [Myxococcota bacterium]|nr:tetratricopeptide repeat protein [Myxococcota bacterium]
MFEVNANSKLYVSRGGGKVLGPFPLRVVEQMVRSRQLGEDAGISVDNHNFVSLGSHPHFAPLLSQDFGGKVARTTADADLPAPRAELPSPRVSDLPASRGGMPRPQVADLSMSQHPLIDSGVQGWGQELEQSDALDLPVPAGGEMFRPRSSGDFGLQGNFDLPSPKGPELPVPKGAGLPLPKPAGLPVPKPAGLPVPKPAGLPVPKPAGLPVPQGHNLPSPAQQLPSPGYGASTPNPFQNAPTGTGHRVPAAADSGERFSGFQGQGLNSPTSPRQKLISGPSQQRSGTEMLGSFSPDEADEAPNFGGARAGTQMLGSFRHDEPELPLMSANNLPLLDQQGEDDFLMGNRMNTPPKGSRGNIWDEPATEAPSDFDPLSAQTPGYGFEDADPLGLGSSNSSDVQEDPLGLGGARSAPPPRPNHDPLGLGASSGGAAAGGDPLGLVQDPLGLGASPPPMPGQARGISADPLGLESSIPHAVNYPEDDEVDGFANDGMLASPNSARSSSYGLADTEEEDEALELDFAEQQPVAPQTPSSEPQPSAGRPAVMRPTGNSRTLVMVGFLVLVLLGAALAYFFLGSAEQKNEASGAQQGNNATPQIESALELSSLQPDTYLAYTKFIDAANAELTKGDSPKTRGLLLGTLALTLTRYPELSEKQESRGLDLLSQVRNDEDSPWSNFGQAAWLAYKADREGCEPLLVKLTNTPEFAETSDLLRGLVQLRFAQLAQADRAEIKDAHEKAVLSFERADQLPAAHFFLGLTLEAQGKPSQATRAFEATLKVAPEHISARLELARLKTASGELDEAKDFFSTVLTSPDAAPNEIATAHQIAGLHALHRNDIEFAIAEFQEALELNPLHEQALRGLGEAYVRGDRYNEGITFFTERFGAIPKESEVQLALTRCYLGVASTVADKTVLLEQAKKLIQTGRQSYPNNAQFPYLQAQLEEMEERVSEAESSYQTALDIEPDFALAKIQLARLLSMKGTPDADLKASELVKDVERADVGAEELTALAQLLMSKGESAEAIRVLNVALERNPSWVPAHRMLVEHYVSTNNMDGATKHLDALRRLNALTPALRFLSAKAHYTKKEYKDAIEVMADVVAEQPENPTYQAFLGEVYFARGSFSTAQRYFEDALALDTGYVHARYFIGRCHLENGDFDEALKVLRQVHDDRPSNGEYHFWLGFSLEKNNRYPDALREYNQLLARAGDSDEEGSRFGLENPLPLYRRGAVQRIQAKRAKAQADLEAALKIDPNFTPAREELARVLYESGQIAFAATALETVREQTTGEMNPELYFILAMSYLDLRQTQDAITAFEQARDRGFSDSKTVNIIGVADPADVHRTLGYLYRDQGRKNDALNEFELYLRKSTRLDRSLSREIELEISRLR